MGPSMVSSSRLLTVDTVMPLVRSHPVAAIFLVHFCYFLLIQLENALLYGWRGLQYLLIAQAENVTVASLTALLLLVVRSHLVLKILYFFLNSMIIAGLFLGQFYFSLFRAQFSLLNVSDVGAGELLNFLSSILAELGAKQLLNAALALFALSLIWSAIFRSAIEPKSPVAGVRRLGAMALLCLALAVPQYVWLRDGTAQEISKHPLIAIWRGVGREQRHALPQTQYSWSELFHLRHGTERPQDSAQQEELLANTDKLRDKNIVFVLLESVGSQQLLRDGSPDPAIAPFLSSMSSQSIIFDDLHNTFPGSTRSHVAFATGGETITRGSVFSLLTHRYRGETMASMLKHHGYKTALFSAAVLNYENLNSFYIRQNFDRIFYPELESGDEIDGRMVHSWSIDEEFVIGRAMDWIRQNRDSRFFVTFLSGISHHPYGAPAHYKSSLPAVTDKDKYRLSISYIDHSLQKLVQDLKNMGLEQDTVLFIAGDHGEAFGEKHADNFLHRDFVYEENIRNFLIITDLSGQIRPAEVARRGFIGDVMPTMLATQGIPVSDAVQGQNLLSPHYRSRITYFHKNTFPEKWGLRDGKWKFIEETVGSGSPELYDLDADPDEQNNVSSEHPSRIAEYRELVANWYVLQNERFVERLDGYEHPSEAQIAIADATIPGPKRIAIGIYHNGLPFMPIEGSAVHPEEALTVWTEGVAYRENTELRYVFTGPDGTSREQKFTYIPDWSTVRLSEQLTSPRTPGQWILTIYRENERLLTTQYRVDPSSELHWSATDTTPGIRKAYTGTKADGESFQILSRVNPLEKISLMLQLVPYETDKDVVVEWIAPDGRRRTVSDVIRRKWSVYWLGLDWSGAMEKGVWQAKVWVDSRLRKTVEFEVADDALLSDVARIAQ